MLRVLNEGSGPAQLRKEATYLATARESRFGAGFFAAEHDGHVEFHWMGLEATLELPPAQQPGEVRFLELQVFSEFQDLSQTLAISAGDEVRSFALLHGWFRLSLELPEAVDQLALRVNKLFPPEYYPGDGRGLAVRVSSPLVHGDPNRHRHVGRKYENAVHNLREMLAGATRLASYPTSLGIDMYGVCNVKPPCVYCDWDASKEQEGENVDAPFTRETLEGWGDFFDSSAMLVNCSIGEPFMMKNIDELFDIFGDQDKFLEITTNGQILTERNIQRLLGRDIHLYISLDAATPETYAKLRNDKFERILTNIRRLVAAKGGRGGLPLIYLVFMPMRVNVHEVEAFVRLCADLGVDRLILRPLIFTEQSALDWDRAGHHFSYIDELLPFDELVRVSGRVAALCERYGVALSDQLDFGGAMDELFAEEFSSARQEVAAANGNGNGNGNGEPVADVETPAATPAPETVAPSPLPSLGNEKLPVCFEPWKSLYILRRGSFPCCYGSTPLGTMDEYREVWNGSTLQEIRAELAAGRFHPYCLGSVACPIVRKSREGHVDLLEETGVRYRLLDWWHALNARGRGIPGRLLRPVKRPLRRLLGLQDTPASAGPA